MDWTRREREALAEELRGRLRGEVRFTDADRALYSTDASIYQVLPIGVVLPEDQEDAALAIRICLQAGAPILPRGGGTSLAGQTVGHAVVVDLSRNLAEILEVDPEARWARVEPGVIQNQLNRHLAPDGLMLGPDTASGSRATLGGMAGNNSSGAHSVLYGKMIDHVRRARVALADGTLADLGPVPVSRIPELAKEEGVLGRVWSLVQTLRGGDAQRIRDAYPKVMRRVSGYNLEDLLAEDEVNLAKMLVGSEGSLGTLLDLEVDLVPTPRCKGLALVNFEGLEAAVGATAPMLGLGPSAVELMDDMLLGLAAEHPSFLPKLWFMTPETKAIQLVEFYADNEEELVAKMGELDALTAGLPGRVGFARAEGALEIDDAWAIRKAGLPLLASMKGRRKPLPFVEDTAVDPEKLPAFVSRFKEIVESHQTRAAYFAHASAGCLHIRPLLDLSDQEDRKRMESISEQIFELVVEFGGSMSGEHGDGRSRSHYNERLFGPEVYEIFCDFKRAFDPGNLFNPGQVVDAASMSEHLREDFHRTPELRSQGFSWEAEGGFLEAVGACNGTASCRQIGESKMCPTYQATRDEEQSTRGRANLLRSALRGALPREQLFGPEVAKAMDLCLSCKACKSECPVKVDMAKLRAEWLYDRNRTEGMGLRRWALSRMRTWLELADPFRPVARALSGGLLEKAAAWTLGLDTRRPLPELAPESLEKVLAQRTRPEATDQPDRGPVVLFADCFSRHMEVDAFRDAVWILERAGHEVLVPELGCCGRPAVGQGDLALARELAEANVAALAPYVEAGTPLVGTEPGCLSMFWDEVPDLVPTEEARAVSKAMRLFEQYLLELVEDGFDPGWTGGEPRTLGLHPHCHQDALGRTASTRKALELIPDLEVQELGGGCCGMAGDFGHTEHELSKHIWARTEAADWEGELCVPGWSCRQQVHEAGKQARPAACILRESCPEGR